MSTRKSFYKKVLPFLLVAWGLATGGAQAALTAKPVIYDALRFMGGSPGALTTQVSIDGVGANNENPVVSNSSQGTPAGTGFKWGGFFPGTSTQALRGLGSNVGLANPVNGPGGTNNYGVMLFYNHMGGQYEYTLFDSTGGNTPNQYVDLSGNAASASFYHVASGTLTNYPFKVRFMLRSNANSQWYVSDPITLPQATTTPVRIVIVVSGPSATKWYAVDSAVNTNLNLLAASDEMALSFASTAATPNFTKVDGGGLFIDSGGTDVNSTAWKPTFPAWAANDPTVLPSVKATCSPSYPKDTTQLVLGPAGATPLDGSITIASGGSIPVTISSLQVVGPAGQFAISGSLPSLPATISGTQTVGPVNITWTPPANTTSDTNSSASLAVTTNGGVYYLPIVGRMMKNVTIKESFNLGPNADIGPVRPGNQSPQIMAAPPAAGSTGFKWGGFNNATDNTEGRGHTGINNNRITFYGGATNDATGGGNYHGSYMFTIFDSMGGVTPDYSLKLEKFQFLYDQAAGGQAVRALVRDASGQWFISNNVMPLSTANLNTLVTFDLDGYTWKTVNADAVAYMNANTAAAQVAISEPGTLPAGTLSLNGVTGAGVYVETGETNPATNVSLTIPDLNFLIRPSNNDRLAIKANTAVTTSNTAIVPNKRIGLMAVNCAVTSGMEVALDGLDVTVNSSAGLRTMYLYSDPNANGLPDDGGVLTSCTVSGTTAKLALRNPEVVAKGTQNNYALIGEFDDTAAGKSYTFTVQGSKWRQNTTAGGTGDQITQTPDPATVTVKVSPAALPVHEFSLTTWLKETWENVTLGALPTTPATGTIANSDLTPWNYAYTGNSTVKMPVTFVKNGSTVVAGVETKDMSTAITPWDAGFNITHPMPSMVIYDSSYTQIVKLDFTAVITSTTLSTMSPHFSTTPVGDASNVGINLVATDGPSYQFTLSPVTDPLNRSFFWVARNGATAEYAPGNILAYSSGNGTGHYQFSLWYAPTFGATALTTVKVDVKHVESGKTASWTTQINGSIDNVKNVNIWFGAWANTFVDDITLTSYQYFVNPVRSWMIYQ